MVTLGVSTERGAVHAVALADTGARLPERVLLHRMARARGDSKTDIADAVASAMDEVADEIGPEHWIAGTAVVYRDAAERRAIVTRLASGPWHSTSLVSTKSAHLSLAGMMSWLEEYDHLLICEVVPGYQSFTLVDRARSRVLAATSQSGVASADSLSIAVTAAWDQLEAAAVRPDAVVLIGSAADAEVVRDALSGFGAPVLPCPIAVSAPAAGAAMSAMSDVPGMVDVAEPAESLRYGRGTAALLAAAGVMACGLIAGGVYTIDALSSSGGALTAEAHNTADTHGATVDAAGRPSAPSAGPASVPVQPGIDPGRVPAAGTDSRSGESSWVTVETGAPAPQTSPWWGTRPLPLDQAAPVLETEHAQPALLPGAGIPENKVGAPDGSLLFPGEAPPPPAFTPEAQQWWDNHFRLMMEWASEQLTPEQQSAPRAEQPNGQHSNSPQTGGQQAATERAGTDQGELDQRRVAPENSDRTGAQGIVEQRGAVHAAAGRHSAGRHAAA